MNSTQQQLTLSPYTLRVCNSDLFLWCLYFPSFHPRWPWMRCCCYERHQPSWKRNGCYAVASFFGVRHFNSGFVDRPPLPALSLLSSHLSISSSCMRSSHANATQPLHFGPSARHFITISFYTLYLLLLLACFSLYSHYYIFVILFY